jgi:Zn-dependent peptidase ImmA (M78 family)
LNDIATDLWVRGIPVVPLDVLPAPSFQGVACIVEDRPVVLLGHKYDEPGRVAFLVAHEAGHVAAGDCAPDQPVVDKEEEIADDTNIERRADQYARRVLIGSDSVPVIDGADFKALASQAETIERETGAEASTVIFAWARHTGDYAKATMAVKALYRGTGARRQLRQLFDRHVDLVAATESDRALLRCVYGDPERDEGSH